MELKPCPKCNEAKYLQRFSYDYDCGCIRCKCGFEGPYAESGEEAEHLWNALERPNSKVNSNE